VSFADEKHEPPHHLDGVAQRHGELGREQPLERRGVRGEPGGEVAGALAVEEADLLHHQGVEELLADPLDSPFTSQAEQVGPAPHGEPLHHRQRPHEEGGEADPADVAVLQRAVHDDPDALGVGEGRGGAEEEQRRGAGERLPLHPEEREEAADGGEAGGGGGGQGHRRS